MSIQNNKLDLTLLQTSYLYNEIKKRKTKSRETIPLSYRNLICIMHSQLGKDFNGENFCNKGFYAKLIFEVNRVDKLTKKFPYSVYTSTLNVKESVRKKHVQYIDCLEPILFFM
jgi:hypothetical protein